MFIFNVKIFLKCFSWNVLLGNKLLVELFVSKLNFVQITRCRVGMKKKTEQHSNIKGVVNLLVRECNLPKYVCISWESPVKNLILKLKQFVLKSHFILFYTIHPLRGFIPITQPFLKKVRLNLQWNCLKIIPGNFFRMIRFNGILGNMGTGTFNSKFHLQPYFQWTS